MQDWTCHPPQGLQHLSYSLDIQRHWLESLLGSILSSSNIMIVNFRFDKAELSWLMFEWIECWCCSSWRGWLMTRVKCDSSVGARTALARQQWRVGKSRGARPKLRIARQGEGEGTFSLYHLPFLFPGTTLRPQQLINKSLLAGSKLQE